MPFFCFQNSVIEDYKVLKKSIVVEKTALKAKYESANTIADKKAILDETRKVFTNCVVQKIVPSWMGTKWSFYGHTEIPLQGDVACGYFVSTTLNHGGLNINRYKLAQKSPENEALTIALSSKVESFENWDSATLKNHFLTNKKDGLYFVGLDFHVGYLFKQGNEVFFIHSNYIKSQGVTKELIENSTAIISKKYFIAEITYNEELIKKWLLNGVVKTN